MAPLYYHRYHAVLLDFGNVPVVLEDFQSQKAVPVEDEPTRTNSI